MVLPRYRAPVVAPPYFVPVDTANCRTFLKFGSCGLFFRQKIYFAVAFTAGFVGFPTFYCDRIAQQNQRNKENCVKKICSCRAPTRPKLSHFSLRVQQETLGCKRLKIKRRINFATRLILLRPSHANFDFLFSNFAVRDFILFALDFNT